MNLIKTKSFELAVYIRGDKNSLRLALVLPGRLDTKDYPHMRSHVEFLGNRGFHALSFDPPGTWESTGAIELYTMTNYLRATNELIEYFDNRPTFVFGHSRGGSVAMLAAIENPNVTHFASAMGNYSYAPGVYSGYPDKDWQTRGFKVQRRDVPNSSSKQIKIFNLPYSFFEDQMKYDALDGLGKYLKPKLFILGTKDTTVKPEVVKKAYEESAPPKELFSLDSDHNYRVQPQLIDTVNEAVGKFLYKYSD